MDAYGIIAETNFDSWSYQVQEKKSETIKKISLTSALGRVTETKAVSMFWTQSFSCIQGESLACLLGK